MSEHRFTDETALILVTKVLMRDMHHVLGRITAACLLPAAFFALAVVVDLYRRDWHALPISVISTAGFVLTAHETWTRRRKYHPSKGNL